MVRNGELWPTEATTVATPEEKARTLELITSGPCTCDWRKRDGYNAIRFSVCAKCQAISDHLYGILDRVTTEKGGN